MRSNHSTKSPLRILVVILFGFTVALSYRVPPLKLSSYREQQQQQQQQLQKQLFWSFGLEEIETSPESSGWSGAVIPISKRQEEDGSSHSGGQKEVFSDDYVDEAIKILYQSFPNQTVNTSRIIQEGIDCSFISTNLHRNHIPAKHQLQPKWIHQSELIGMCPTKYVTKEVQVQDSKMLVVEAVCSCANSKCAREGYMCHTVSQYIPTVVSQGRGCNSYGVEKLTIACACIERGGGHGATVDSTGVRD